MDLEWGGHRLSTYDMYNPGAHQLGPIQARVLRYLMMAALAKRRISIGDVAHTLYPDTPKPLAEQRARGAFQNLLQSKAGVEIVVFERRVALIPTPDHQPFKR